MKFLLPLLFLLHLSTAYGQLPSEKSDGQVLILLLNYNNSCVACLEPVPDFYAYQKKAGNKLKVYVNNLEEHYVQEYLEKGLGFSGVEEQDILSPAQLTEYGLDPSEEHEVACIEGGGILFRKSCTAYFYENRYTPVRPALDSFELKGDFSSLKYRYLGAYKIDSQMYLLMAQGYEHVLEVYNKQTEQTRDLLKELPTKSFINAVYDVYFGKADAPKALLSRKVFAKAGRIGRIKEFSLENDSLS